VTLPLASLVDSPALGQRPFLTWYGEDGERTELSATVTANWVAKTANLLVEEYDIAPGTLVRLDMPPHWRTAVWALATWRVGAGVVLDGSQPTGVVGGAERVEIIVTDRPAEVLAGAVPGDFDEIVAQVLPSLARKFDGELPPGSLDAALAIGSYGDVIGYAPPTEPSAPAVVSETITTLHGDLAQWSAQLPPSARLAVRVGPRSPEDLARFCRTILGALRAETSLVLLSPSITDPTRILATERATLHP